MSIRCTFFVYILLSTLSTAVPAQVVEIPDPILRQAVRETLNLPAGTPITQADMRQLTQLDARDRQITELAGLEYATNLSSLTLGHNEITDLTPIAGLMKLEHLWVWVNPISNLSPLANLTKLKAIDFGYCNTISDISPIANLTNLSLLQLRGNRIVDVSPLENLTKLTELHLHNNQIVDVSALVNLSRLESLEIHNNAITDYSSLDGLSLTHFTFDESCEMPPLPILSRIQDRDRPSVFAAWGGIGWSSVLNRPDLSDLEQMSLHDLYWSPMFGLNFRQTSQGVNMVGSLEKAQKEHDSFLALNPNLIFLVEIRMRDAFHGYFPEDSPYWVRDASGEPVPGWPGTYLVDFTHPNVQELIVQQAIAVSECGLYDGIFFDWYKESIAVLRGYRSFEAEQRARDTILQRIRTEVRHDFLVMVNTNWAKIPRTAPYINGDTNAS